MSAPVQMDLFREAALLVPPTAICRRRAYPTAQRAWTVLRTVPEPPQGEMVVVECDGCGQYHVGVMDRHGHTLAESERVLYQWLEQHGSEGTR